jgi:hypothetical protein
MGACGAFQDAPREMKLAYFYFNLCKCSRGVVFTYLITPAGVVLAEMGDEISFER